MPSYTLSPRERVRGFSTLLLSSWNYSVVIVWPACEWCSSRGEHVAEMVLPDALSNVPHCCVSAQLQ